MTFQSWRLCAITHVRTTTKLRLEKSIPQKLTWSSAISFSTNMTWRPFHRIFRTQSTYYLGRRLDNSWWHRLEGGPKPKIFAEFKSELQRLSSHMDKNAASAAEGTSANKAPSTELASLASAWADDSIIGGDVASSLNGWLAKTFPTFGEGVKRARSLRDAESGLRH